MLYRYFPFDISTSIKQLMEFKKEILLNYKENDSVTAQQLYMQIPY